MLDQHQKTRIRSQMAALTEMPIETGKIFYAALFRRLPEARPMFGDGIDTQAEKLVDMVFLVVHFLDSVEALSTEIEELGARHVEYGMDPSHLDAGRLAFLEAIATLYTDWTAEDESAWDALLTHITDLMRHGMHRALEQDALGNTG